MGNNGSIECPHLEKLIVSKVRGEETKNLANFLRMNRQLRSLSMGGSINCLQAASECSQLEELDIWGSVGSNFVANSKAVRIHFKTVRQLYAVCGYLDQLASSNISILFEQLEVLKIRGNLVESDIDFISKHPFLSEFRVHGYDHPSELVARLPNALPSVTTVCLTDFSLSIDHAINFVNKCALLKKFRFRIFDRTEYGKLQKHLDTKWRSSWNYTHVTLER